MRRLVLIVGMVLALVTVGDAAIYKSFETVTVTNAAVGLTATTYKPTAKPQMDHCVFTVESADIRIRFDGTDPTASVGIPILQNSTFTLDSNEDMQQLKMIRQAAVSATVTAACWAN